MEKTESLLEARNRVIQAQKEAAKTLIIRLMMNLRHILKIDNVN